MIKRIFSESIICSSMGGKKLQAFSIRRLRVPLSRLFLTGILCLCSALYKPCFASAADCAAAQDAVENGELDPEDYADMYPFCGEDSNIDMPLDEGVPFLFLAAALFGAVRIYKRQNDLKSNEAE